jgi:hypothetical protein
MLCIGCGSIVALRQEAARSIAVAEELVPGAWSALPELISKAADGTLTVKGRTPDGTYEWIDRAAWVGAEIREDGQVLLRKLYWPST